MARREIFVSYHHQADQHYYNQFESVFSNTYRVIQDNSLRFGINSDDAEYVMRRIREEYLTGTSCTIVLCGKETHLRKFVDWEIKATLDKEHGLIGIKLPTNPAVAARCNVPARFFDNYQSGYGPWLTWEQLFVNQQPNVSALRSAVTAATSKPKDLINNSRSLMSRNIATSPKY